MSWRERVSRNPRMNYELCLCWTNEQKSQREVISRKVKAEEQGGQLKDGRKKQKMNKSRDDEYHK